MKSPRVDSLPVSPSMMSISSRNRAAAMAATGRSGGGRRHKKTRFKKPPGGTPGKGRHKEQHLLTSELQELIPSQPVPNEAELNHLFAKMVDELGLNREIMWKLPPEKKWQLYLSRNKDHQSGVLADPIHQPEMYVEETLHLLDLIQNMSLVEADIEDNLKIANDLKTALRTQPLSTSFEDSRSPSISSTIT